VIFDQISAFMVWTVLFLRMSPTARASAKRLQLVDVAYRSDRRCVGASWTVLLCASTTNSP